MDKNQAKQREKRPGKKNVILSRRLLAVAGMVKSGKRLCDVGCDHALIPIWLLLQGRITGAIAMDIIPGPIEKAGLSLDTHLENWEKLVELRLSDGLDSYVTGEAQSLVIAGMGGMMICRILTREPDKTRDFEEIILAPQSDWAMVRTCITEIGFSVAEEAFIQEDGKFYPVLRCVPAASPQTLRGAEAEFGPVLLREKDPVLREFLGCRREKLEQILAGISREEHPEKYDEINERLRLSWRQPEDMNRGKTYMKRQELITRLEQFCPGSFAMDWDHTGVQVGNWDGDVSCVYIALDATSEVIDAAAKSGAQVLLTHHPLLFSGCKDVTDKDYLGKRILKLAREDITCIAMHTNFDVLHMADAAADELRLLSRQVLEVSFEDEVSREGIGRVGDLAEHMTLQEFAVYVKEAFKIPSVRFYGDPDLPVVRAAVLPGSGKDEIGLAADAGADVMVTGDITHHVGLDAVEKGIAVIDAGHYGIEKLFVPYMKNYLTRECPELRLCLSPEKEPFTQV